MFQIFKEKFDSLGWEAENAALIYRENQEKEDFIKTVEKLMTMRSELAINIKKFALPNAADTIAKEVLNMLNINA